MTLVGYNGFVETADGRAYLYAHDANGNVAALVDAGTGEVAARYAYAAFGATLVSEGPLARRNPFRFSSEYADDETGLIYYDWRHYDPIHGAWLGRDPIGVDGGANLYAFCGNDPIDNIDELGCSLGNGKKMKGVSLTYVSDKEGFDWAEFWAGLLIGDDTTASVDDFNPNSHLTECECVKNLMVIMHGYSEGNNAALVYWGKDTLIEDVLSNQLSNMFSEIKFCDKCTLELRSCYIGKNQLLKKRLEQKTGCEVKLYENRVTIFGREDK